MALQAGIVGLPNVGKSTLFIAVSNSAKAQASNYRFCTIEPNLGTVSVPDQRLFELEKIVKKQKVTAKINMTAESKGDTTNPNIIAEIQGKKDSKVIVLGAQLDSWDFGEGAIDDGTGVVQCIEVLRTLKALGYENNHTIRVVLYANSENGGQGREMYAAFVKKRDEKRKNCEVCMVGTKKHSPLKLHLCECEHGSPVETAHEKSGLPNGVVLHFLGEF